MRHILGKPLAIPLLAGRVVHPSGVAPLVAVGRKAQGLTPADPRTLLRAVDLAAVAGRAHNDPDSTARTQIGPGLPLDRTARNRRALRSRSWRPYSTRDCPRSIGAMIPRESREVIGPGLPTFCRPQLLRGSGSPIILFRTKPLRPGRTKICAEGISRPPWGASRPAAGPLHPDEGYALARVPSHRRHGSLNLRRAPRRSGALTGEPARFLTGVDIAAASRNGLVHDGQFQLS